MVTFFRKHAESFFAVAIVVIGAFLRLYRIADYMTFLGDEGRDVLVVYNILHGHLTLLGPTASVGGFFFGPIYYYFMTPFLWLFNYNPVGPAVMVALFGTATIFLVYKVGKIFFNGKVGLIAAFFYAISPVIISYSRSSWNPNPLPFFSILTILFIYKGLLEKKIKYLFLAGISLGIAMELHFVTLFLGSVVFLYVLCMWLFNNKGFKTNQIEVLIKQYIFIFLGFFIGWIPYLGFEVRHGFPNTRSILAFIFQSGKVSGGS
ncbi:MAG: ArnT family glycosyltransferase, partial [Candidatus Levyibacteriota bacterium]